MFFGKALAVHAVRDEGVGVPRLFEWNGALIAVGCNEADGAGFGRGLRSLEQRVQCDAGPFGVC